MNIPKISIVTITFKQVDLTCQLLVSLQCSRFQDFETIVVDNAPEAGTEQKLKDVDPGIIYIASEENKGFSGANNLGIAACKGEYIFLVNNDTEVFPQTLDILYNVFQEVPNLGIVSPMIYFHSSQQVVGKEEVIQYAGMTEVHPFTGRNSTIGLREIDKGQYIKPSPTGYAHGAAMMIPKKVIEHVGSMPEAFFLYYEDLDWCEQIRSAGYQIYFEPRAKIYHKESQSVGKTNPMKTYYLNRNRILFMKRNKGKLSLAIFWFFTLFISSPKNVITYILRGQIDHLQAYIKSILWHFRKPTVI